MKQLLAACCIAVLLIPHRAQAAGPQDTSIGSEISAGLQRLAGEAGELATTPFQTANGNLLVTLGVAGAVGLTYAFDRQIQDRLTAGQSRTMDRITDAGAAIGNPFVHLGLAALTYGGGIAADSPWWKETGEMMGEALVLADALTLIVKEAAGRGRPDATKAKGDFRPFGFRSDYDSFPSMHSASSFALASVLSSRTESMPLKASYYTAAAFVGYSRVYQNRHWASDIILGAAVGELCGRIVTGYHAGADRSRLSIAPAINEKGAGLAMVGTW